MPIMTNFKDGVSLWHGIDRDRAALHQYFQDWCDDPANSRRFVPDKLESFTLESFTFEGETEAENVYSIVVVYQDQSRVKELERENAVLKQELERVKGKFREIQFYAKGAGDRINTVIGEE